MTTIECVSAAGEALPPLVIFKGKDFTPLWLPEAGSEEDTRYWEWRASDKGWTSDYLAFEWLTSIFQPRTVPANPNERRLLILDGHGSHLKSPFIGFCIQHAIDLMVLPSHSSHMTQPLDVGIFGPLKRELTSYADKSAVFNAGRISKSEWATNLVKARKKAMSKDNIMVGWKNTGLSPFAPFRVLRKVPTPSTPTQDSPSTLVHL